LCGAINDRIADILSSRPRTLLHGDLRADNIFRTPGTSVADATLSYIDFQLMHAGPPGPEFAEAWIHSLEPDVRREDQEILREYHERLVELEPAAAAYTYEMLLEDSALSSCLWWNVFMAAIPLYIETFGQPESAGIEAIVHVAIPRMKEALLDLDCLSRIQAICAVLPQNASVPAGD
jgi:hypothetical protein